MLCVAFLSGLIVFSQENDFRTSRWGSSLSSIKGIEKSSFVMKIKDDELVYKDLLDGEDCEVYYIFNDNDKLESGVYRFTKKYSNPQLYVEDYKKFKTLLEQKYGKPTGDSENWSNNTTGTEKHNFGQAVADGNLSLNSIWHTERSTVKIVLSTGTGKQPVLQINYTTKSLNELENIDDLKAAVGKL